MDNRPFTFPPGTGDWTNAFGVVTVPPEVGQLVVLLEVRSQKTDADVCWFDNVEVYRLDDASF